ncbi:hypothetical protein [Gracilimonas sp.]|uniref:hypothetical protein n=1 Tax=Gracilimonas sp. TaxID=1974203 RepID=UPI003D10A2FE
MHRFKLFLLLTPFYFMGCAALYVPDSRSTITFEDAGELHTDVSLGSSGFEIKTAYSITDYFGLGYSGSFSNRTNDAVLFKPHKHTYNELIGLINGPDFGTFGRLSLTIGAGSGSSSAYDDYVGNSGEELYTEGKFNRFYVQPTITFKHDKITYGLASRFSTINFSEFSTSVSNNRSSLDGYYFEPTFFIRTAGEQFRFILQVGGSSAIDDASENAFNHEVYHISGGVSLDVIEMVKKISNQ